MNNIRVVLDAGHGKGCGNSSPDGRLVEFIYAREIVAEVFSRLFAEGYNVKLVTPELQDIKLKERVRRINSICEEFGASNVLSVSVHVNAAKSDKKWHNARGWVSLVSKNASMNSKKLSRLIWEHAIDRGLKGNRSIPTEGYIQQNLAICRDTKCPAVLVEVGFMDNESDVEMMLSEKGRERIISTIVQGIKEYIEGK